MHSLILAMSGNVDTSDLRRYTEVFNKTLFVDFLNHPQLRRALHIPSHYPALPSDCNTAVHDRLRADTMRGVRGLLPFLLYSLPIVIFTGAFDLKDGTWSSETLVDGLWDWDDRAAWFLSRRYIWRPLPSLRANTVYSNRTKDFLVNHTSTEELSVGAEEMYGYSKSYGNFSFVTISQAGHMAGASQPQKLADLFYRFTRQLPFYNDDSPQDQIINLRDATRICKLLQCEAAGHGRCDTRTTLCICDDNWTGATCSIPIHHVSPHLFPSPSSHSHSSSPLTRTRFTEKSVISPQQTDLYYLHVTADDVEMFGLHPTRHSSFSSHQTIDNVLSSCTFNHPLLLRVRVQEHAATSSASGHPESKQQRNLGLSSDGHLSVSVLWTSKFHNHSPHNASLFLGSFDASNTFFSSGGSTSAQSIAP